MKKISELFSEEELDYLSIYKPDLVPMNVPSRDDLTLLDQPSLDQIIIEFLKQYEVNVEPRNVGAWNGWDTIATLGMLFSKEGSTSNIASTIFASNRSNQISGAAQDWGTWKRWALDHKDFDKYKGEVIQAIELHNNQIIDECDKQIKQAELNNKKISDEFKKPGAKEYITKAIKINKEKEEKLFKIFKYAILSIPIILFFFTVIDQLRGGPEIREKNKIETLEKREKDWISYLVFDAKRLVDYAPNNPLEARDRYRKIIGELPIESYNDNDLVTLVFYNYFINEVNIKMSGQYQDASAWCKPQDIFNYSMNHWSVKNTPLTRMIRKDELFWIQEIGEMCSEAESASYEEYPNSIRRYNDLELYSN